MYYTVYKVTNKVNGKVYIGTHKTKNLDDGYMGSGKYLKHSINKHGIDKFEKEILCIFETPEEMTKLVDEQFVKDENTYNLKVGGYGSFDYLNNRTLEHINRCRGAGKKGIQTNAEYRLKNIEKVKRRRSPHEKI